MCKQHCKEVFRLYRAECKPCRAVFQPYQQAFKFKAYREVFKFKACREVFKFRACQEGFKFRDYQEVFKCRDSREEFILFQEAFRACRVECKPFNKTPRTQTNGMWFRSLPQTRRTSPSQNQLT